MLLAIADILLVLCYSFLLLAVTYQLWVSRFLYCFINQCFVLTLVLFWPIDNLDMWTLWSKSKTDFKSHSFNHDDDCYIWRHTSNITSDVICWRSPETWDASDVYLKVSHSSTTFGHFFLPGFVSDRLSLEMIDFLRPWWPLKRKKATNTICEKKFPRKRP